MRHRTGQRFVSSGNVLSRKGCRRDINVWYGLPAQGTTVDDWADDAYDHSGLRFIGGTSLHVRTEAPH
jgi:hypothetical protein